MGSFQLLRKTEPSRPVLAGLSRDNLRIDLESELLLRFPNHRSPVKASSANLSTSGMFVRSRDSQPVGLALSFELPLRRRDQLISGQGEVVWMRQFDLGADRPAGMGIRFLDLDEESRRLVRSFIAERSDGGAGDGEARPASGAAADASYVRPLGGLTSTQARTLHAYAGCAAATPEREWRRYARQVFSCLTRAASNVLRRRRT